LEIHPKVDLVNIFESFLPQLLRYPNPTDPLNGEAAALLLGNQEQYTLKVRDHVSKHASQDFQMSSEVDDRKAASEDVPMRPFPPSTATATATASPVVNSDLKLSGDDDVEDNASEVSDMSDL
jgi:hypothetical protein